MFNLPSIENLGGRLLSEKKYYDAFVNNDKHVEIDVLKTKDLVKQHVRYSHFVFHLGRGVTQKGRNSAQSGGGESGLHWTMYFRNRCIPCCNGAQAEARNGRAGT